MYNFYLNIFFCIAKYKKRGRRRWSRKREGKRGEGIWINVFQAFIEWWRWKQQLYSDIFACVPVFDHKSFCYVCKGRKTVVAKWSGMRGLKTSCTWPLWLLQSPLPLFHIIILAPLNVTVALCICFHQLLEKASLMTIVLGIDLWG